MMKKLLLILSVLLFSVGCDKIDCPFNHGDIKQDYYIRFVAIQITDDPSYNPHYAFITVPWYIRSDHYKEEKVYFDKDLDLTYGPYYAGDLVKFEIDAGTKNLDAYWAEMWIKKGKDGDWMLVEKHYSNIWFTIRDY